LRNALRRGSSAQAASDHKIRWGSSDSGG
jgi:hypothetical protein